MKKLQFFRIAGSVLLVVALLASCTGGGPAGVVMGTINGVVMDSYGNTVADVTVTFTNGDREDEVEGAMSIVTDADGFFEATVVGPGDFTLLFVKDGFITVSERVTIEDEAALRPGMVAESKPDLADTATVEVTIYETGASLAGTIYADPNGYPSSVGFPA